MELKQRKTNLYNNIVIHVFKMCSKICSSKFKILVCIYPSYFILDIQGWKRNASHLHSSVHKPESSQYEVVLTMRQIFNLKLTEL